MKTCTKCKQQKPLEDYFRTKTAKDGRESACKVCKSKKNKEWYESNKEIARQVRSAYYHANKTPERIRQRNLKVRYGLDLETYEAMIVNGCAVCGSREVLSIDHDHNCCPGKETCGKCIRGVLCRKHNMADGMFDTIEQIEKYLEYRKGYTNNG